MYKKILKNFLKENFLYSVSFFLSAGIILFYFYVSRDLTDFFYPLILVFSIYIIFMVIQWFKYYRFNINLTRGIEKEYYDLDAITPQQKMVQEVIFKTHKEYEKEISKIEYKNSDIKYFVSQGVHNMKTPVSVINLIIQREKDNIDKEIIKNIEEENYKIKNGLEQVLNVIRLDQFSRDYEPEVVDLVGLIKSIINSRKNQFIYGNVFPKLQFNMEEALVLTDKKWSGFIIDQVVSNSIKYSKKDRKGYVYFNIIQDNEKTHMIIKDEGVGIPKYDLRRVFEPFFTGENGRKFENSTGIGLYMCKKIADNLGHEISIESEPNKGTSIKITYISKVNL